MMQPFLFLIKGLQVAVQIQDKHISRSLHSLV